jgi:hypothetical protein
MSNNPNLDDELAEFTDRLFSGNAGEVSADNIIEARLVSQLHNIITNNPQPSPAFRTKLTHRLNDEWKVVNRENRQESRSILSLRFNRNMAMAAAIITALLFVLLLYSNSSPPIQGTVGLGSILIPAIFIASLLVLAALFFWFRKR